MSRRSSLQQMRTETETLATSYSTVEEHRIDIKSGIDRREMTTPVQGIAIQEESSLETTGRAPYHQSQLVQAHYLHKPSEI